MRLIVSLSLLALGIVAIGALRAKIINPVTLEQVVKDQPIILTAKVSEFLPDNKRRFDQRKNYLVHVLYIAIQNIFGIN